MPGGLPEGGCLSFDLTDTLELLNRVHATTPKSAASDCSFFRLFHESKELS